MAADFIRNLIIAAILAAVAVISGGCHDTQQTPYTPQQQTPPAEQAPLWPSPSDGFFQFALKTSVPKGR